MIDFWNYEDIPAIEGWYSVLICYDPDEGAFPNAAFWNGTWDRKGVVAFGTSHEFENLAIDAAYKNDPERY